MKFTVKSPANIAFIKYWGRADHDLFIPLSTTNSMNLSACSATTTVEFSTEHSQDTVTISGEDGTDKTMTEKEVDGLDSKSRHLFLTLAEIRESAGLDKNLKAKVHSRLSFPMSAGIASSAAGISAFTSATLLAAGLNEKFEDKEELSRFVRRTGSPSAARSVLAGFTELLSDETDQGSYTRQIADEDHWDLIDLTVVTSASQKKVSSSRGHELAETSPLFSARKKYLKDKPEKARAAIVDRDFQTLAELAEADWLNMFAVMQTSKPAIVYFNPGSIAIYQRVQELRADGVEVFTTFDAGPNPHLICTKDAFSQVEEMLTEPEISPYTEFTLKSSPCAGTHLIKQHLF